MKKLLIILAFVFIILFGTVNTYSEGVLQLSYNGKLFPLKEAVLSYDNEHFLDARELSPIIDLKFELHKKTSVSIELNGVKQLYDVKTYDYAKNDLNIRHNLPELINDKLYLPFGFLKGTYKLAIKYNSDKNIIYILPRENSVPLKQTSFKNITYDYTVDLYDKFRVYIGESDNSFDDNSMMFIHKTNAFAAVLTCDKLDAVSLNNMRKYLNDFNSSDLDIFQKFSSYKDSYFYAMQDFYKRDFLYATENENASESNLKVISDYNEKIYGLDSHIVLYNTIKSEKLSSNEESHLSVTIPDPSSMTVYSVNFTLKKGSLSDSSITGIHEFLRSLQVSNLPRHNNPLKLFSDPEAVNSANLGIYPDPLKLKNKSYSTISNPELGYEISYPSAFLPFRQNNLVGDFDYKSFKIDYNHYFSVFSEPADSEKTIIIDKINFVKGYNKDTIKVVAEGTETIGGNRFQYLKYEISKAGGTAFIQDYYVIMGSTLFSFQLNSHFIKPTQGIQNEFINILGSLRGTAPSNQDTPERLSIMKYLNRDEGYSVLYPSTWQRTGNDTNDIYYDSFSLKNPDFSGPIEVIVNEGELISELKNTEILKYVTGSSTPELKRYFKKYSAPYLNRISQLLASTIRTVDGAVYLYKLINYLDESNRGKFCYSVDIIRDKKMYSLFITASDYITLNGRINDKNLDFDLNFISKAFGLENTDEYVQRKSKGETRNQKVVVLENFIKQNSDRNSHITSVSSLTSTGDLLVDVDSPSGSTFYRLKTDFDSNSFHILETIKKKDALELAAGKVKQQFSDKILEEVKEDISSMTIQIKYRDNSILPALSRSYQVTGILTDNTLDWKLERRDYSNAIKNDCVEFLSNLLSADIRISFNPDEGFSDVEEYKENGKMFYIPAYVEFGGLSGYFVLKVNPFTDSISLDSYTPIEKIHDRINRMYSLPGTDFSLNNIGINESDKFEFQLFLSSKYSVSFKLDKVRVHLNSKTRKLEVK